MEQLNILASQLPLRGESPLLRLTYPWLAEIRRRSDTIDFLLDHELTRMEDHTNDWPILEEVPKPDLDHLLTVFKRKALLLLYRLADCVVGHSGTMNIRAQVGLLFQGDSCFKTPNIFYFGLGEY